MSLEMEDEVDPWRDRFLVNDVIFFDVKYIM